MENNDLMVRESVELATARACGLNYIVDIGGRELTLKRNDDFMKVKKAKRPSLLRSGAEKILMGYGLYAEYELLNDHKTVIEERNDRGASYWFNYEFKCILHAGATPVATGVGSANTREGSTGTSSGFDQQNRMIKVAKKRALVDAVLCVSGLSGMFKRDIEDDELESGADTAVAQAPLREDDPITSKQLKRLFAIAAAEGKTVEQAKQAIHAAGYAKSSEIKQKDYDKIIDAMGGSNHDS
jgi:hypothetical protein